MSGLISTIEASVSQYIVEAADELAGVLLLGGR
jgi:hypothetical protein